MVFDNLRQRKALARDMKNREEELRQIQLNMAYGPFGQPPTYNDVAKEKLNASESITPIVGSDSTIAYSTHSTSTASSVHSAR